MGDGGGEGGRRVRSADSRDVEKRRDLIVTRRMVQRKENIVLNSNNNAEQRSTCDGSDSGTKLLQQTRRLAESLRFKRLYLPNNERHVEVQHVHLGCRYPVSSTSTPNSSFQFQRPTAAPPNVVQQGLLAHQGSRPSQARRVSPNPRLSGR